MRNSIRDRLVPQKLRELGDSQRLATQVPQTLHVIDTLNLDGRQRSRAASPEL
jgi:hypothetical protein